MKTPLLCFFISLQALVAQPNLEMLWADQLKNVPTTQPVPQADQKVIIEKTAALLRKHVTFRADGTASSNCKVFNPPQIFEWKNLHIAKIVPAPNAVADQAAGIDRRFFALLGADASRVWNPKINGWTDWNTTQVHLFFPTAITVTWKGKAATAEGNNYLPSFAPGPVISSSSGPAPSVPQPPTTAQVPSVPATPAIAPQPAGKTTPSIAPAPPKGDPGLPPGMSRDK